MSTPHKPYNAPGPKSGKQLRHDARDRRIEETGGVRCPDCNADAINPQGLSLHKRKACVVIPGARARLARKMIELIFDGAA